ncbi:hypothetical protein [Delftia acidovorans]|uniref:hypothetical protein n=1 Tax=Delftia acidovorans TaxID=80866 RepID=UPI0030197EC4
MPADKVRRNAKTGRFEDWSPLSNPAFLQGVRVYVKAADVLLPLFQSMADAAQVESPEWVHLRTVASVLRDMASNMAAEMVREGERLILPQRTSFVGLSWANPDDSDVLLQCVHWHGAARDVQWFFAELGLSKKPPAKVLKAAKGGDQEAVFTVMAYMLCNAMEELKSLLVERLSLATDGWYLNEAKKSALRLSIHGRGA